MAAYTHVTTYTHYTLTLGNSTRAALTTVFLLVLDLVQYERLKLVAIVALCPHYIIILWMYEV